MTNCEAAEFILNEWNFPKTISAAIGAHYAPELAASDNGLQALLNLACGAADRLGFGLPGEQSYWESSAEKFSASGVTDKQLDAAAERGSPDSRCSGRRSASPMEAARSAPGRGGLLSFGRRLPHPAGTRFRRTPPAATPKPAPDDRLEVAPDVPRFSRLRPSRPPGARGGSRSGRGRSSAPGERKPPVSRRPQGRAFPPPGGRRVVPHRQSHQGGRRPLPAQPPRQGVLGHPRQPDRAQVRQERPAQPLRRRSLRREDGLRRAK